MADLSFSDALRQAKVYSIKLPKGTAWQPERARVFTERMVSMGKMLFRIVAEGANVAWQIVDLRELLAEEKIILAVRTIYPEAEVSVEPYRPPQFTGPFWRALVLFEQADEFVGPILYPHELKEHDPLVSLTNMMAALQPGERIVYNIYVSRFDQDAAKQGQKLITQSTITPFHILHYSLWFDAAFKVATGNSRTEKYVAQDQRVFQEKLNHPILQSYILVELDSPDRSRLWQFNVSATLWEYANLPFQAIAWHQEAQEQFVSQVDSFLAEEDTSAIGLIGKWLEHKDERYKLVTCRLNTLELASLWHLPHDGFSAPTIAWSHGKQVQLPAALIGNRQGVELGVNRFAGREEPVFMLDEDRRVHVNIVGKTGVGKSTLMHRLIHQDIAQGRGVAVIDPHGTLVRDILQCSIPGARETDVVVLDLANEEYPAPLNPLGGAHDRAEIGRIVGLLNKMYGGMEQAPRMANALTSALMTLWCEPQPTVRDVARLFLDEEYRARLLEQVTDEVTLEFWYDEYENFSPAQQQQIREPVVYRMRSFYGNPDLYPIVCHPDSLNLADLIRQNKIILLALGMDERRVPEREQNLLGALVISQLQMVAMSGVTANQPFYLYVDEVQNFVTSSLDQLFSEARKFGLSLTVANQFLGQLTGPTLDAVMGNVGATVTFRCGLDDARALAPHMKPGFETEDLVNLDMYQAAVKMQFRGQTQGAFSLETCGPLERPLDALQREERIRRLSATQYTPKTHSEVREWLSQRYPRPGRRPANPPRENEQFYDQS